MWEAWSRMRHAPLFAVTAALALVEVLPKTRWMESLAQSGSDLFRPPSDDTPNNRRPGTVIGAMESVALPVGIVMIIFGLQWAGLQVPILGRGWAKPDPAYWPFDLVADLRQAATEPRPRIFNELAFGGFLIMETPGLPVFIDDRCELYPGLLPHYVETLRADPATRARQMEDWTREHGLNLALTHAPTAAISEPGRPFDDYFRSAEAQALGWYVVRQSTAATLFARRPGHTSQGSNQGEPR
jgi:hypothetical protein